MWSRVKAGILFVDTRRTYENSIQKWGNSLALRIPKSFAAETHLEQGTLVEVSLQEGKLLVTPLSQPAITLEELLKQVTPQNLHHEVDTGPAVGGEVW